MKQYQLLKPLFGRFVIAILAALGGWLAGQYPEELKAICGGFL